MSTLWIVADSLAVGLLVLAAVFVALRLSRLLAEPELRRPPSLRRAGHVDLSQEATRIIADLQDDPTRVYVALRQAGEDLGWAPPPDAASPTGATTADVLWLVQALEQHIWRQQEVNS